MTLPYKLLPQRLFGPVVLTVAALAALSPLISAAETPNDASGKTLQNAFIWTSPTPPQEAQYVVFRRRLTLDETPREATLHLFADSRYALWINGKLVERGPCRFDPKGPQYDTLDVAEYLASGENAVAVLVHHYHGGAKSPSDPDINGRTMLHRPGLTACLEWTSPDRDQGRIVTDASWRFRTNTRFLPVVDPHWSQNWGSFPDVVDARRWDGDWTAVDYDDSKWAAAVKVSGASWGPLVSRIEHGIPLLKETPVTPLHVLGPTPDTGIPLDERLPITLKEGEELLIDPGRFVLAYVDMEFDADEGSRFTLSYPQQYYSTGNRPTGSLSRSRYTARQGTQRYTSMDVFGMRYLRLRCDSGRFRIDSLKLTARNYPFEVVGRFSCNDKRLDAIWKIGLDTMRCCSEDAYVDCVCRERAEWLGDGVLVAFPVTSVTTAGPTLDSPASDGRPLYGDARLFRNLLRHIGQSQQPDGRVKAHHPSDRWDKHGFIDDYACLWIQGILEYYRHAGDLVFVREMLPAVERQLAWFEKQRTPRGLVRGREFLFACNPLAYKTCEGTTLNCYLFRSLRDAAELERLTGNKEAAARYAREADTLEDNINTHLWDEATGSYLGGFFGEDKSPATAHAAVAALYFNVVPDNRKDRVAAYLRAQYPHQGWSPYSSRLLLDVLFRIGADKKALDFIRTHWMPMVNHETRSTWEGFTPHECCHECGTSPTWLLSTFVLGVQYVGDTKDRHILIRPHLADLTSAEGTVVTPFGPVEVKWDRGTSGVLEGTIVLPERVTATVDTEHSGGDLRKGLGGGRHELRIPMK